MSDRLKRLAAEAAAAAELKSGMRLGLGTGSTARHIVDIVGERIKAGESFLCVPTSEVTRRQAESLAIPLTTLDAVETLDLTIDGADEFDEALNLIKGGGAALLREKIVAFASRRMIVIADQSKHVARLGSYPLPIEVVQFAHDATRRAIIRAFSTLGMSCDARLRKTSEGAEVITDNGNLILDCHTPGIPEPGLLAQSLSQLPGLVEHGLFIGLCSAAYLATDEGVVVFGTKP
ncbi:RpiA Ribose 5-phosphate isomerase [Rhabdaerophilaceae bacterium]